MQNKKLLAEPIYMRLILIFLLVLYHSFCIYTGGWSRPTNISEVKVYWWIGTLAYSFMMETFVFISGYVYGFQVRTKYSDKVTLETCIYKKAKRLLIPSVVFSAIYLLCFGIGTTPDLGNILYRTINGEGHMWFLPMLFWCFVAIYLIEYFKLSSKFVFVIAAVASMFSLINMPLRLSESAYYFLFFYCGYFLQRKQFSVKIFSEGNTVFWLIACYISAFLLFHWISDSYNAPDGCQVPTLYKVFNAIFQRLLKLVYSLSGTFALYSTISYLQKKTGNALPDVAIRYSTYCFGVYILQQFILMFLVYNQSVIMTFGTYLLPWVCFIIALVFSLVLTKLLLKTRIGAFLIG